MEIGESRRIVHESIFGPARLSDVGATGGRRLVVVGRIKPGRTTIESTYDNAFGGNPRAIGLVPWNPVFPKQPKGWRDGDDVRKERIESEDRV